MNSFFNMVRRMALLTFGISALSQAAVFQNVVVNGNFTVASGQSGSGWSGTYSLLSSTPTLSGGGSYFYAGSVSSREVNQIYTLTASEQELCKGAVGVTVQGMRYFLSADLFGYQSQGDYSRLIVEFRNSAGTVLDSHTLDSRTGRPATWPSTLTAGQAPSYQFGTGWAPSGTTSARIRVIANRTAGDDNDGYIDNVRLELHPSNVIDELEGEMGEVIRIGSGGDYTRNASKFRAVAAGGSFLLALKDDGTVVAWGYSAMTAGLSGVVDIAAGYGHGLALKDDGSVVALGSEASGQNTPPAGLSGVVAIAAGWSHNLALKSDGTVVAWGSNSSGQSTVPAGLSGVVAIAAGYYHSLALKGDGTLVVWGSNSSGQSTVPAGLSGVVAIAAGFNNTLALKGDGSIVAWGSNSSGQNIVPAGLSGVVNIAVGSSHNLALKADGTVVGWGSITSNQSTVPVGLSGVVDIAAGRSRNYALKSDGTMVVWGNNYTGQVTAQAGESGVVEIAAGYSYYSLALKNDGSVVALGSGASVQNTVPAGLSGVVAIAVGASHNLALKGDGTVMAWGDNDYGQSTVPAGLSGVVKIAAGYYHSLALKADGTVVAWGRNYDGQTTVPAGMSGMVDIAAGMYLSYALKGDGSVVAWGSYATMPAGLSGVVKIAAGYSHGLALKNDGTVVAWGDNSSGQSTVPAGLSGVTKIVAGLYSSAAGFADGSWVTWGDSPSMSGEEWWKRNILSLVMVSHDVLQVLRSLQPEPPQALYLAKGAIWENRPADLQNTLWTDDPNLGDTHSYELVSGVGDNDNALFTLTGQTLTLTTPVDFEQKSSYLIRGRVTDSTGFTFEEALVISVVDDVLEDQDNDGLTQRQEAATGTSDANPDMDNDGHLDGADAFPLDPTEWLDPDGDGIGNNADPDDDNDGAVDAIDAFPLDIQEMVDSDGDSIGNNADPDDDNDGIPDTEDPTPQGTNPARLDLAFGTIGRVRFPVGSSDDLGKGVALQTDGKIVVAGSIWNGSNMDFAVARFMSDGAPDPSFAADGKIITQIGTGSDFCQCVAVQADGKILIAGHSFNGNTLDVVVVRYTAAGILDTTFSGDGIFTMDFAGSEDRVNAIYVRDDGKILVAGDSRQNDISQFALLRLTPTGALDTSFGGGTGRVLTSFGEGLAFGWAMAVQEDGRIVMAGEANGDFALARYYADGSPDLSLNATGMVVTDISGSGTYDYARTVTIQDDGRIVLAGNTQIGTTLDMAVVRYTTSGQLDGSFGTSGIVITDVAGNRDAASGVAMLDDKILVGGTTKTSQDDDFILMRLTAAGDLDSTFNGNGIATTKVGNGDELAMAMAVQPDGKIVMAGFSSNGTNSDFALLRHMGDPPLPEIVVEGSNGEILTDNQSTLTFQVTPATYFTPNPQTVIIRNTGVAPLSLLSFLIEGSNASHFQVVDSTTVTNLGTGAYTSVGVTFSAPVAGSYVAVLKIITDDPNENPFRIHLAGTRDALSFTQDTDGDGLSDASESNMALLGFDWTTAQPDLVNTYYQNAVGLGFYRASQVQTLRSGSPKLARDPSTGRIKLTMDWKIPSGLGGVTDFPAPVGSSLMINPQGDVELEFTAPDDAAFLRIELE